MCPSSANTRSYSSASTPAGRGDSPWTALRVTHRLPPLSGLSPTNSTGPITNCFAGRKKPLARTSSPPRRLCRSKLPYQSTNQPNNLTQKPGGSVKECALQHLENDVYGGRVPATVELENGDLLSDLLIPGNYGRAYDGGTRGDWCGADLVGLQPRGEPARGWRRECPPPTNLCKSHVGS